jgi:pimeloyl-ACP methyl ester carboxylesterase
VSISVELGELKTVELAHGRVSYRDRGEGPPILFVHGLWVNGDHWRKVVPELAGRHRCISPDLPLGAHTKPMSPDADLSPPGHARLIADLIEALGLEDVTVVANDTGDALAQILVTEHPERIARLVLTPGDAFTNFLPWSIKPARVLGYVPALLRLAAWGWTTRVGRLTILTPIAHKLPPKELLDTYSRPAHTDAAIRRDLQKFFRHARPRQTLDAARKLRSLPIPALIVWQKAPSPIFPKAHGRRLARIIPGARHEEVGETLAFIPEDQPERLAGLIAGFAS